MTYGVSTLQEQKKSPVFASAGHLVLGATVNPCDSWVAGPRSQNTEDSWS